MIAKPKHRKQHHYSKTNNELEQQRKILEEISDYDELDPDTKRFFKFHNEVVRNLKEKEKEKEHLKKRSNK